MHALYLAYGLRYATPPQLAELSAQLAPAFAAFPGLVAQTWLRNDATGRYGSFAIFDDKRAFERFVASELFETIRSHPAVAAVEAVDFVVDERATAITRGA
jgi:hypothetical protein